MITPSQHILLESIRASLFDVEFNYPEDANWEEVVAEAKAQTVMGLISHVIPVNDTSADQCKASYMRIMYEQDKLVKLLDSAGIPCVVLKGSAAAVYYTEPYLRAMGDIDVLVPCDMFYGAADFLESNGYVYTHGKGEDGTLAAKSRHIGYSKNGVEVELHHHFSSPGFDFDDLLELAIDKREYREINGFCFPMLPVLENGLVLLGHMNMNLKENTLGLRQIIDWMMYLHSVSGISSWENEFTKLAQDAGLLPLAAYVTKMCNNHLGLPDTFDWCRDVNDDLTDDLLEILLTDGNCGRRVVTENSTDERRMRSATYKIKREGFFRYFTGIGLGTWGFAKNHKVPKPLAFFYGLFRQLGEGIKALFKNKNVGKQMSAGKKRYELYKKLGVRMGEK